MPTLGHMGKDWGQLGGRGGKGKHVIESLLCFHGKEWVRQGTDLKLATLNNFSDLHRRGANPSCLIPVPGLIRIGKSWP